MTEALQKIERIKSIFLDTQLFCARQDNPSSLIGYLEKIEPEFRSIGYESASMAIALKDLQKNQGMDNWLFYARTLAQAHKAQVYVGLGWAIAKLNLPFLSVVEKIETRLYHRVADGCGYYDGSFRQRQTIINPQLPLYLPEAAMPLYDQGIGRSLWYTSNADINKIHSNVDNFPVSRHAGLWRGIGIAVAYVGGCDEETLKTLLQYAGTNRIELAYGAALAARSRMEANAVTTDTDRCSRLWFTLTANEVNMFSIDPVERAAIENEEVYLNWIAKVEEGLANSFEKALIK
jgi:enediyne biosynthesis protein E3